MRKDFIVMTKQVDFRNTHMVLVVARVERYSLEEFNVDTKQIEKATEERYSEDMYFAVVPRHFDTVYTVGSYASYEDIKTYIKWTKIKEEEVL